MGSTHNGLPGIGLLPGRWRLGRAWLRALPFNAQKPAGPCTTPVGDLAAAIEVKATQQAGGRHFAGLEAIREDHPRAERRILVCLERRCRVWDDGIEVLPVRMFLQRLRADDLF